MSDSSLALGKRSFFIFLIIYNPPPFHTTLLHQSHSDFAFLFSPVVPPHDVFSMIFCLPVTPQSAFEPSLCFSGEWKCVKTWFDRGALMHSFQSAAQKVLQGKGLQGMKSYMQRQPAPQSSQSRETQPCNSSPAEVLSRIIGLAIRLFFVENIRREEEEKKKTHTDVLSP